VESWEFVIALVEELEKQSVPYMVVGSLSASVYGLTRSTKDADFVLQLGSRSLASVIAALGPEYRIERQLSFETNTNTIRQRIFVGENGFLIELFRLSDDAHDQERFRRRIRRLVPALAREVFVSTAEDVILTKTRWISAAGRSKDREDVIVVLAVQHANLDWAYLDAWSDRLGIRSLLEEIRSSVPDLE
jgi:hypothetical protein